MGEYRCHWHILMNTIWIWSLLLFQKQTSMYQKLHVKYNGYPTIPYAQRCNKEWIILCDTLGSVVSNLSCGMNSTALEKKKNLPHQCY